MRSRCTTAVVTAAIVALTGAGVERPSFGAERPPVRTDAYGDLLPPGARARLGSVRWYPEGGAGGIAFAPDGKTLVSNGGDGRVHLWEVATGREVGCRETEQWKTPQVIAFSADGKTVAAGDRDFETWMCVWDVAGRKVCHIHKDKDHLLSPVTFSPDGRTLALFAHRAVEERASRTI